jgi:uncharacterized membrane protein YfcA
MELNFLIPAFVIGFLAEMLGGSLGMGFGVLSSGFLLATGMPPAVVSATVNLAKIFTTGTSSFSHFRFGNIDKRLMLSLLPGGLIGCITGALLISGLPSELTKPIVAVYLFFAGLRILRKGLMGNPKYRASEKVVHMSLLGMAGGFLDAIGGGGWGPVVTSTLVARGNDPRRSIGSSAATEFCVVATTSLLFVARVASPARIETVLGLIIGGVLAAPIGAYICGRVKPRYAMIGVGTLISILSIVTAISVRGLFHP